MLLIEPCLITRSWLHLGSKGPLQGIKLALFQPKAKVWIAIKRFLWKTIVCGANFAFSGHKNTKYAKIAISIVMNFYDIKLEQVQRGAYEKPLTVAKVLIPLN